MTTWYSKELGDGDQAYRETEAIQNAFLALSLKMRLPYEFAVFTRMDRRRQMTTAYFSPKAAVLAQGFSAQPCDAPVRSEDFGLLVGDDRAIALLFPTQ